jgi:hypothetical protein
LNRLGPKCTLADAASFGPKSHFLEGPSCYCYAYGSSELGCFSLRSIEPAHLPSLREKTLLQVFNSFYSFYPNVYYNFILVFW